MFSCWDLTTSIQDFDKKVILPRLFKNTHMQVEFFRIPLARASEIVRSKANLNVRCNDTCAPDRFSVQAIKDKRKSLEAPDKWVCLSDLIERSKIT
jgi:hypothetical protein